MKYLMVLIFFLFYFSSSAFAMDQSYCIQNTYSEFGNTETCFENISLTPKQFKQVCEPAGDDMIRVKARYASSCPANYKAVCRGIKTQSGAPLPYISYLYENAMSFMKKACVNNGGKWEEKSAKR